MLQQGFMITVIGEIMIETWGRVVGLPTLNTSARVNELHSFLGGMAVNSAIALASLGCKCELLSYMGRNITPEQLQRLQMRGISLKYCETIPGDSPATFGFFKDRGYHHYYYSGMEVEELSIATEPTYRSKMILLAGSHHAALRDFFKSIGSTAPRDKIMFSPSYALYSFCESDLREIISCSTIVALNREETSWLCEQLNVTEGQIPELGPDVFVHTRDVNGCTVYTPEATFHVDAIPTTVSNPIGAGDAFNAGFIVAYLSRQSVRVCAEIGTVLGSLAVASPTTFVQADARVVEELWKRHF
jgi:sugar/nucleoside kinase (ribokinase family)